MNTTIICLQPNMILHYYRCMYIVYSIGILMCVYEHTKSLVRQRNISHHQKFHASSQKKCTWIWISSELYNCIKKLLSGSYSSSLFHIPGRNALDLSSRTNYSLEIWYSWLMWPNFRDKNLYYYWYHYGSLVSYVI